MRFRKSTHAVYKTEYHIVWTPRYRRKLFQQNIKEETEHLFKHIPELAQDIEVKSVNVQPDHIHMVLVIPPRLSVAEVVQYIKVTSAKILKAKYGFMAKAIWSRGYCVSTIGMNEKAILAYVANQDKQDRGQLIIELE